MARLRMLEQVRIPVLLRGAAAFALSLGCSGCVYGLLYTNIRQPLVVNMRHTSVGEASGMSSTQEVRVPLTTVDISAEWSSRAIGDAANAGGIEEIYYADLHTITVLLGIWRERTVEVYGKKRAAAENVTPPSASADLPAASSKGS